jgi:hypothetical protein
MKSPLTLLIPITIGIKKSQTPEQLPLSELWEEPAIWRIVEGVCLKFFKTIPLIRVEEVIKRGIIKTYET